MKNNAPTVSSRACLILLLPVLAVVANGGSLSAGDGLVHDPAAQAGAGLHKELIAGITAANFLKLSPEKKVALLTIVAAFTGANQGMNFNGYDHGNATFVIPEGWTVKVVFINPSPIPHSVVVVEPGMLRQQQMGQPFFKGASTPEPAIGTSVAKVMFEFVADKAGDYALACGMPTHAMMGHWVHFNVSATARVPTLQLGDEPPREAK